jgi:hypothetical protein
VDGFLIDEQSWAIRYLIVNTSNWWLGHHALVAPGRIGEVSWSHANVTVSLSRQEIKDAPTYDSDQPPDLETEPGIYTSHGYHGHRQAKSLREASSTSSPS